MLVSSSYACRTRFNPRAFVYVGDAASTPADAPDLAVRFRETLATVRYLAQNATASAGRRVRWVSCLRMF